MTMTGLSGGSPALRRSGKGFRWPRLPPPPSLPRPRCCRPQTLVSPTVRVLTANQTLVRWQPPIANAIERCARAACETVSFPVPLETRSQVAQARHEQPARGLVIEVC
jgi:hypothetical protein